ncbi:MAG: ribosome-associated translation inhibitor RaiA, partial [Bacteroidia bacterium]|nr:ribosome-associated translation inhibitor RaiA [Bacteroidia bacterium]
MRLQIYSIHFDADVKLQEFIEKKVHKLETFFDNIIEGEVYLRLEKGENTQENKAVEIKLFLPGTTLFAKDHSTTFEAAADEAVESMRRQIKKYKEKLS